MAQATEAEKYETLGVIGMTALPMLRRCSLAHEHAGKGSFGIIRKVRRVADSHVSLVVGESVAPLS